MEELETSPVPRYAEVEEYRRALRRHWFAAKLWLRDSVERRIKSSSDVSRVWAVPVMGQLRASALGQRVYTHEGPVADSALDIEAVKVVRGSLGFLDRRGAPRIVLVTSAGPEEGKTTLASTLAYVAAAAGKRTLLVEADLRRPVVAERLGIPAAPGLTEYLVGKSEPQEVVRAVPFGAVSSTNGNTETAEGSLRSAFACIPAGSMRQRCAELLDSEEMRSFLAEVAEVYELVVLDTSPLLAVVDTLELVPYVDGVAMCVRAHKTTRDQVLAAKKALDRLPTKPIGIVVTGLLQHDRDEVSGPYAYGYV